MLLCMKAPRTFTGKGSTAHTVTVHGRGRKEGAQECTYTSIDYAEVEGIQYIRKGLRLA